MKTRNGQGFLPHALALSLALHLLVLSGASTVPVAAGIPQTLKANLRPSPEQADMRPAELPASVPPAPAVSRAAPVSVPSTAAVAPGPAAVAAIEAPQPQPVAPSPVLAGSGPAGASPATTTLAAGEASRTSVAPSPSGAGPDPDGLRSYRMALAREARRFKRYPREAKAAGWTGTAEVRLEVGEGGTARTPSLARSSGHEALDGAALAMTAAAAQATAVPAVLRGKAFTVVLPVEFELAE